MENQSPKFLKILAQLISYILHPLFIPTYFFLYLMQVVPFEFASITDWQLKMKLFSVFWLTAFFPAFAVFLLWRLKFSDSIFLKTQKDIGVKTQIRHRSSFRKKASRGFQTS